MHDLITIILAEDNDNRMQSSISKYAHKACGKPILSHVINAVAQTDSQTMIVVLGRQSEQIKALVPEGTVCIIAEEQSDSGYSFIKATELLKEKKGNVLILYGDTPAISGETLNIFCDYHNNRGNEATIITAYAENPIDGKKEFDQQMLNKEINASIVLFNIESLLDLLPHLNSENCDQYSPMDIIKEIVALGKKVGIFETKDAAEIMRVNNRAQLDRAEQVIQKRIIDKHMKNGVTFHLPQTCMVHPDVAIGRDTVIYPGTSLEGKTVIGKNCAIGPHSTIKDSLIGDDVNFVNSVISESEIGNNTNVGPFAYIRPGSKIGQNIKIGDFVEIKNSIIDDGTKVPHLSYVGDADIGKNVNIGCGTVFVNYDGKKKHRTRVGDHAFVGCNVNLVSPVVVNDYAYIAAGSTITDEIPEYALAIARSRQTVIESWVKRKGLDKK